MLEGLESRLLLDGNVTALVAAGNLFVYGDANDNDIIIEQGLTNPDEFSIMGRVGTGTTVNGTAEDTRVGFAGVTRGIWAWLAGGDDAVKLDDAAVPGTIWVDHGTGNSTTDIDPTTVGGDVWVWCGSGLDTFSLTGGTVAGRLSLYNGAGGSNTTLTDTSVTGSVVVISGVGSEQLTLNNAGGGTGVGGDLVIANGSGGSTTALVDTTVGGNASVTSGDGTNNFTLDNASSGTGVVGSLSVINGAGGGTLSLSDTQVGRDTTIITGGGDDQVSIDPTTVGRDMVILTGAGNDQLTLGQVTVTRNLVMDTGAGDDQLTIDDTSVGGVTQIWTGPGWTAGTDDDTVNVETADVAATASTFTSLFCLYTGGGADAVTLGGDGANDMIAFGGTAIGDGGAGTDTLNAMNHGNTGMNPALFFNFEDEAPIIDNQTLTSVDENSTNGTVVGTVAASDPDAGDTLTYTITGGNTGDAFAINASTGEVTVNSQAALDFETTPIFNLTVQVEDSGGLTDDATVTINLNDITEP